ncbi:MAG: hypothetical protein QOE27_1579, partial [Solirubrobacteraceae bacterium]|nr:hypothetical protein [Solirubrobacteraceae bacterium]
RGLSLTPGRPGPEAEGRGLSLILGGRGRSLSERSGPDRGGRRGASFKGKGPAGAGPFVLRWWVQTVS